MNNTQVAGALRLEEIIEEFSPGSFFAMTCDEGVARSSNLLAIDFSYINRVAGLSVTRIVGAPQLPSKAGDAQAAAIQDKVLDKFNGSLSMSNMIATANTC
jgi:hypothetical protein